MIRTAFAALGLFLLSQAAHAEVLIDIDAETVRKAVQETTLEDLSINDSVLIYKNFCIKDSRLYILGWTQPANLAASTYTADGVILKAIVLPGKKLRLTYVDAAQAQSVARGNTTAPAVLSTEAYKQEVRSDINRIFSGGLFGTVNCDSEQAQNPLRKMTLFDIDSLNGFTSLSALLESPQAK